MATNIDEAGNEIIDQLKQFVDWEGLSNPPEDIVVGTKREGHPRAFVDDVQEYPAVFIEPQGWPMNRRVAKQDEHRFSCRVYLVIAAAENTEPYREVREQVMQIKRNIVAAKTETGHLIGLDYIAEMRWLGAFPDNQVATWLRDNQLPYACCAIGFEFVTYSDAEDYGT